MDTTSDGLIRSIEDGRKLFEERYAELTDRAAKFFRDCKPESRDEAIANVMALTWESFVSLIERALANDTLLTSSFYFACKATRSGRRAVKGCGYKELFNHSKRHNLDMDAFVSDRTSVFDAVCFRVDTESWLASLPEAHRQYAVEMAAGDCTKEIANRHNVSPAAVSMRRTQLKVSYEKFIL